MPRWGWARSLSSRRVNYFSHLEGTVAPPTAAVQPDRPAFANDLGPDTSDDLGGSDFGISDAGSWDNGGGGW